MTEDLAELRGEGWKRLLAAARRSLERTGGALDRSIGLTSPTDAERRVVIGITGSYRPQTVNRLTIGLAALDAAVRQRHGIGLRDALVLLGGPLRDRPAEREREQRQRAGAVAAADASVLAGEPWFGSWWSALEDDGTITRLLRRRDDRLLGQAVAILEYLHSRAPGNPIPLPVLAEQVTGDTKALLAGGSLATLVLRALATRSGHQSVPRRRTGQRALWEMHGAIPDDLASQVLVLNVACRGSGLVSGWLNEASRFGVPFRLTLQQQAFGEVLPDAADVFVCENPAVLRVAASDLGADCPALVCTEGVPSAACHKLLGSAVAQGARLHWRADFDWTGLRIVSAAIAAHGARPWRMTAADYRHALETGESTPLTGSPTASPWEPGLAALLAEHGRAVMEERLIAVLMADLAR
ncbi:MAG: TIGR02679 family protein [Trebonia sp.]